MSTDTNQAIRRPAGTWSAADAAALREDADACPEIGESSLFQMILDTEGLQLDDVIVAPQIAPRHAA